MLLAIFWQDSGPTLSLFIHLVVFAILLLFVSHVLIRMIAQP